MFFNMGANSSDLLVLYIDLSPGIAPCGLTFLQLQLERPIGLQERSPKSGEPFGGGRKSFNQEVPAPFRSLGTAPGIKG
jgi:hypothetical protein